MSKLELLNRLLEEDVVDCAKVLVGHRHAHLFYPMSVPGYSHGLKWEETSDGDYELITIQKSPRGLDYANFPEEAFPERMREFLTRSKDSGCYTRLTCSKAIPEDLLESYLSSALRPA